MAYDPGLNRLIALGGTYNPSFVDQVSQGRREAQSRQANNLAMQSQHQQMGIQREQQTQEQQNRKIKIAAAYMQPVLSAPPGQRAALYQQATTALQRDHNVPSPPYVQGETEQRIGSLMQLAGVEGYRDIKDASDRVVGQRNVRTNKLSGTEGESSTKKWERVAELGRTIERGQATPEDHAEFEALTKPNIAVNVGSPSRNVAEVAEATVSTFEKDNVKLKDEVENWEAYRDAVSTEAQAIQARSEKAGNPVSLSDAMQQAHGKLKEKLQRSKDLFDKDMFGFTPFGKRWVYNPNIETIVALPKGMDETFMQATLKKNNLQDTKENRQAVIKAWQDRK